MEMQSSQKCTEDRLFQQRSTEVLTTALQISHTGRLMFSEGEGRHLRDYIIRSQT